jgi:signal transduction histidine kinase
LIRSIFSKILISHVVVILVTTLTMGVLMSFLVRHYIVENRRQELIQKGLNVVSLLTPFVQAGRISPTSFEIMCDLVGANLWIMDSTGHILAGRAPERWLARQFREGTEEVTAVFSSGAPQSWIRSGRRQGDPAVLAALPIPNTTPQYALFLYAPITGINKAADAVELLLFYALLTGTVTALLIAFLISRTLTRPIENIIKSADDFAKGRLYTRTEVTGPDEIGRLGHTFNSMAKALEQTEQNRREFLANVSHEIKTPVASIQALSESLADGLVVDKEQQQRYLRNIVAETGRIDRLVHDLLDLSQLEEGEVRITTTSFDLDHFVRNHIHNLEHLFQEKNLRVRFTASPRPLPVAADPDRLAQVLTNIMSNASRYAPPGSDIAISLSTTSSRASLTVTDQGPGIPSADLPYIFDRFYRVEKSRVRSDGGTGLGLAISKKLMQAMEGDIAVESIEGQGASFTLTLPVNKKGVGL